MGAALLLGPMALAAPASAVIGGVEATEAYPFVTALFDDKGVHYCGGSLIDEQWVLRRPLLRLRPAPDGEHLRAGGQQQPGEGGSERQVTEVVQHPDYEAEDVSDDPAYSRSFLLVRKDISLLKPDSPVEQTPVRIAEDRPEPGTAVRALGWGVVDELGREPKPEILQQIDTGIVPDDRCAELDGDLCSEHPTDEAQVCSTDSGSPMVRAGEGDWELVGLTSRDGDYDESVACVGPWVFTEAAKYGDWAADTVGNQPALRTSAGPVRGQLTGCRESSPGQVPRRGSPTAGRMAWSTMRSRWACVGTFPVSERCLRTRASPMSTTTSLTRDGSMCPCSA
ncbi:trypsin-like serine protease [Nocardiopsis sp. ARC36]